jgi:hypothetical protein
VTDLPGAARACSLAAVFARRLLLAACTLALLTASVGPAAAAAAPSAEGSAAASGKKGKRCKKGYKPKTVTKKGKKVRVCRKVRKAAPGSGAAPGAIFEAPGQKLEGDAAKPFLQRYLLNSTFTDCPAGWPNCAVEERYSHAADSSFYYCRLTSSSGSDIRSVGEYGVKNARVEPDGSWLFNEVVYAYGNYSEYEWHVSANGVVTGAYRFQPGSAVEQLGPLQYVGGARDCSY